MKAYLYGLFIAIVVCSRGADSIIGRGPDWDAHELVTEHQDNGKRLIEKSRFTVLQP